MRTSLLRRSLLACALALAAVPAFAQAPAWPAKPVKLVVNFPAGGPLDLIARSVGDAMQKATGQPFVVENKPGAAGNIGADAVARAPGDGYTILFGIDTTFTIKHAECVGSNRRTVKVSATGRLHTNKGACT